MTCSCKHGEYHGYPPADSPNGTVATIYFWCPIYEKHDCLYNNIKPCHHFKKGELECGHEIHDWREDKSDALHVVMDRWNGTLPLWE